MTTRSAKSTTIIAMAFLLVNAGLALPTQAEAINPLVAEILTTGSVRHDALSLGYQFIVNGGSRIINALGFPDLSNNSEGDAANLSLAGDGLGASHFVGLWQADGTAMASVTVPAGTSAELHGIWRWEYLASPVTLVDGMTYRMALVGNASDWVPSNLGTEIFGSGIAPLGYAYGVSGNANYPFPSIIGGDPINNNGYSFANAAFIPEPASLSLLFFAGALTLSRRRRGN